MSKSIITSLSWVRKGFARAIPLEYEYQDEEIMKQKKLEDKLKKYSPLI
jgi:hypothetical protein